MMKNWKSLFIKTDEGDIEKKTTSQPVVFPVSATQAPSRIPPPITPTVTDPVVSDVIQVYENGLESINMPGYDFYEFYQTVASTGQTGEQTYKMAFQMARTLDKTINASKLLSDAEFYISKINEVHTQYVGHGQQKLNTIQEKKNGEKSQLQQDIDAASKRVNLLRQELQQLEVDINQKRISLGKVDDGYYPQEKGIREKLAANDMARQISIEKLSQIKQGIHSYLKD